MGVSEACMRDLFHVVVVPVHSFVTAQESELRRYV